MTLNDTKMTLKNDTKFKKMTLMINFPHNFRNRGLIIAIMNIIYMFLHVVKYFCTLLYENDGFNPLINSNLKI